MTALTSSPRSCDDHAMITSFTPNLFDDLKEELAASDLDAIMACLVSMTQPHLQDMMNTMRNLARVHMVMHLTGQENTERHHRLMHLVQGLELQIDAAMIGVFN
jgi:hypothetical protein